MKHLYLFTAIINLLAFFMNPLAGFTLINLMFGCMATNWWIKEIA